MKSKLAINKVLCLVLCMMLVFPCSLAAESNADYEGHWAEASIKALFEKGFVTGYTDGSFKPEAQISRAEFMAVINRSFGYTDKAVISFKDVKETDWHYEHIARAVKAGYIKGYADGTMRPIGNITRQEAAVILSRILSLEEIADTKALVSVRDVDKIQEWGVKGIAAIVSKGYISLRKDTAFEPDIPLTRAEMAVAVEKSYLKQIKKVYANAGTFTGGTIDGSVMIDNKDITLKDTVINGDLNLGEGIGEGNVHLINVVVKGDTIVKGGGENSITIENCDFTKIVIIKENGKIRILAKGSTKVGETDLQSGAKLESEDLTGEGFGYVTIAEGLEEDALVELIGNFESVEIRAEGIQLQASGGTINNMKLTSAAANVDINLASDSKVTTFTANAAATVTGTGKIDIAQVNVSGTKIEVPVTKVETPAGVTVNTGTSTPTPATTGGDGGAGGSNDDDDDDNQPSNITISAITSADVAVTKGSIDFAYDFSASGTPITFGQAKAAPYYLDIENSTVQLKTESMGPSIVSTPIALSDLIINDSGELAYTDFNSMAEAFGDFRNGPTHIKLHLVSKTSVSGATVSNPWTYDTDWISFNSGELDVFNLYGDKESLLVKDNLGNVIAEGGLQNITTNLTLDTTGIFGSTISWASSNTNVIANNGTVTRPASGSGNADVTLTATLTKGTLTETKEFQLTVLAQTAGPAISNITTTKDEVTITFSENITSINMPNSITLSSGTYNFDVFTSDGLLRIGHYGLLEQTTNSMRIAILGNWGDLSTESFYFRLYTGDFLDSPTVIAQSDDFTFSAWNGTNTNVDAFMAYPDEIWLTLENTDESTVLAGLSAADFTLFDFAGNKINVNFFTGPEYDPFIPDHEYCLTPLSGSFGGNYHIRFAKAGYDPDNMMFEVEATVLVTDITVDSTGSVTEAVYGVPLQMIATVLPVDATDQSVTWAVYSGTGTATIDNDGLLTGTGVGTVTVRATANDGSAVYGEKEITIIAAPTATISTLSTITVGDISPIVVVTLTGDTFTADGISTLPTSWTGSVGTTGLIGNTITRVSDTQITFQMSGTAEAGTLTLQANAAALTGGVASNSITITALP